MAVDLCSLSEVRQALGLAVGEDTTRDALISVLITAASRAVMREAEREFCSTGTATRTFRWDGRRIMPLTPWDLRTVTTLTMNSGAPESAVLVVDTDYMLSPLMAQDGVYLNVRFSSQFTNRFSTMMQFYGYTRVQIVGTWGFATVPEDVKQATIVTVAAWLRRDVSAYGLDGGVGDNRLISPDPPTTYALPMAARQLLNPYRRSVAI